jgi:hypothetical protein
MYRRLIGVSLAVLVSAGLAGCGPRIDLRTAVSVTDMFSGWYDFGVVQGGDNKLVPSITFRLKNTASTPLTHIQLTVSFWPQDADGEIDSMEVEGIGSQALAPGASTDPILVRSNVGYTLPQPRAELFTHSLFKDFVAKLFAKRGGAIVPLGEFTIDRRIIPHADAVRP